MIRRFHVKPIPPKILAALLVIVIILIATGLWLYLTRPKPPHDFDSCVAAGYPVVETYPEQCLYGTQGFIKDQ